MSTTPAKDDPWTIARLLAWTRDYFQRQNVESPRLCAEILLADALGCERLELYTRHEAVPSDTQLAKYRDAVRQAAKGRPIAYLTGRKEFFSLSFTVTPDVLIPRPETEVLVERVIHLARHGEGRIKSILDVGTGSGCIAVSLAKHLPEVKVFASDISFAALAVAKQNAERHGVLERISFRETDLVAGWEDAGPFDIIASNPPYIGEYERAELPVNVRDHEPECALFGGDDGLSITRRLVVDAAPLLAPNGHFLMEISYDHPVAVRQLLEDAGWQSIVTYQDAARLERVVHARRAAVDQTQVA